MSDLWALQQEGRACKCTEQGRTWAHHKSDGCSTAPVSSRFIIGSILQRGERKCCSGAERVKGLETQADNKLEACYRRRFAFTTLSSKLDFKKLHMGKVRNYMFWLRVLSSLQHANWQFTHVSSATLFMLVHMRLVNMKDPFMIFNKSALVCNASENMHFFLSWPGTWTLLLFCKSTQALI